jgi:hypothetical protein
MAHELVSGAVGYSAVLPSRPPAKEATKVRKQACLLHQSGSAARLLLRFDFSSHNSHGFIVLSRKLPLTSSIVGSAGEFAWRFSPSVMTDEIIVAISTSSAMPILDHSGELD